MRFDTEIPQGYSPVSKRSWVSLVLTPQSFSTHTNDVDVGVGSAGAIVVVGKAESSGILVGELGLRADTPETPWGVSPKRAREYKGVV